MTAPEMQFGTWHCIRLDVVQTIVTALWDRVENPDGPDLALRSASAIHNSYTRLAALALGALNGLRPAEILRARWRHLDRTSSLLAVDGKAHACIPGYRRVPLLPETVALLERCQPPTSGNSRIIRFYREGDQLTRGSAEDLENIMAIAAAPPHQVPPDFYGLRHRFRTHMLASGLPERMLNYVMGHESRGTRTFSIYLENPLIEWTSRYLSAARDLAQQYRFFRMRT